MFSASLVMIIIAVYLTVMFILAGLADRLFQKREPPNIIYALALGIHCTSWAFFGTASQAQEYGWPIIPTYLGISIMMILGHRMVRNVASICERENIASLADYIALPFGRSIKLSILVTLICLISVIPYIALQLDALVGAWQIILPQNESVIFNISITVTLIVVSFALIFGTKSNSLTTKHPGLMVAVAISSLIKLTAFMGLAYYVVYVLFDGVYDLFAQAYVHPRASQTLLVEGAYYSYLAHVVLGIMSLFCLPRQFHMTFIENRSSSEIWTARWLFPLYLLLMSVPVIPISLAGQMLLPTSIPAEQYVLALPIAQGDLAISIMSLLGGFSAATSMIMVSTLALGIMISNNIMTPLWTSFQLYLVDSKGRQHALSRQQLLLIRRITIIGVIFVAFTFHIFISQYTPLVKTGFLAMSLVAHLFPVLVFSMYWQRLNIHAAIMAILAGAVSWALMLLLPSILSSINGLSMANNDMATGLFLSLTFNLAVYIVLTLLLPPSTQRNVYTFSHINLPANLLLSIAHKILPTTQFVELNAKYLALGELGQQANEELQRLLTRLLVNHIGFASTQMLFNSLARLSEANTESLLNELQNLKSTELELEINKRTKTLTQAKQQVEQANRNKSQFLAATSHDLLQPLNTAQLYANVMANEHQLADNKNYQGLLLSLKNVENLIHSMRDIAKLESGVINVKYETFAIDDIITELLQEFQLIADYKNISLRYRQTDLLIRSDKLLFRRILQNLISNALRYTDEGSVSISISRQKDQVKISVIDTGKGIPSSQQQRVFKEFTRLNDNQEQHGIGLGLAIVKGMAKLLDLPINLDSTVGKGSTFSLFTPYIGRKENSIITAQKETSVDKLVHTYILLIEDDNEMANAMTSMLADMHINAIHISQQGQIDLLPELAPSLVMLDYHLENEELGTDVYQQICERYQLSIPGVLISADRSDEIIEKAYNTNLAYLPKPLKAVGVKRLLRKLLS